MLKGVVKNRKEGVNVEKADTLPQGLWERLICMFSKYAKKKMVEELMGT